MKRVYWAVCVGLTGIGVVGMMLTVLFPPEHFDQEGRLIGEMPPEFGIAFVLAEFGLMGVLAGGVLRGALRLWRWTRQNRVSGSSRSL